VPRRRCQPNREGRFQSRRQKSSLSMGLCGVVDSERRLDLLARRLEAQSDQRLAGQGGGELGGLAVDVAEKRVALQVGVNAVSSRAAHRWCKTRAISGHIPSPAAPSPGWWAPGPRASPSVRPPSPPQSTAALPASSAAHRLASRLPLPPPSPQRGPRQER